MKIFTGVPIHNKRLHGRVEKRPPALPKYFRATEFKNPLVELNHKKAFIYSAFLLAICILVFIFFIAIAYRYDPLYELNFLFYINSVVYFVTNVTFTFGILQDESSRAIKEDVANSEHARMLVTCSIFSNVSYCIFLFLMFFGETIAYHIGFPFIFFSLNLLLTGGIFFIYKSSRSQELKFYINFFLCVSTTILNTFSIINFS